MPKPLVKNQYPGQVASPPIEVDNHDTILTRLLKKLNFKGSGVTVAQPNPGEINVTIPGGGGGVTGDPNALVYIDPTGNDSTTDPDLTAAPLDPQTRPQIWDKRKHNDRRAIWRQGAWGQDGDTENVRGEGLVIYEPETEGPPGGNGRFGFVTGHNFSIRRIIAGVVDDWAAWIGTDPSDNYDGFYLLNDNNERTLEIDRPQGNLRAQNSLGVGPEGSAALIFTGTGTPEGSMTGNPGDIYLDQTGAAYLKLTGTGNTGWIKLGVGNGIRDQAVIFADGSVDISTPGIGTIDHPSTGYYTIHLNTPLTIDAQAIPRELIHLSTPGNSGFQPRIYWETPDAVTIMIITGLLNQAVWPFYTDLDRPFQIAIFNAP